MFDNNFNLIEKGHYLFEKTNEKYSLTFSFNNIYNGVNKLQLDLNNNNPTLLKNLERCWLIIHLQNLHTRQEVKIK